MNESEYYASEMSDLAIDQIADAGEYFLDESGFNFMPTNAEIESLVIQGEFYCNTNATIIDHEIESKY